MARFNIKDLQLNKSGTIGTEPIAKPDGKGGYTKGTEIKAGKLGAAFIPDGIVKKTENSLLKKKTSVQDMLSTKMNDIAKSAGKMTNSVMTATKNKIDRNMVEARQAKVVLKKAWDTPNKFDTSGIYTKGSK